MKKAFLFLVLSIGVCSLAFTQGEIWISVGYEQAFFVDTYESQGQTIDTATSSRGGHLSNYTFFNDNVGLFIYGSFLFPKNSWVWDNSGISSVDINDYMINMQQGIIIGFAYKINYTDDIKIYFGIGYNYLFAWDIYPGSGNTSYVRDRTSHGIGGDMGIKIDLTDRFFIRAGSILTLDFTRKTILKTYTGDSYISTSAGRDQDFLMFSVRPYISAGFNLYWRDDNGRLRLTTGKPD